MHAWYALVSARAQVYARLLRLLSGGWAPVSPIRPVKRLLSLPVAHAKKKEKKQKKQKTIPPTICYLTH